MRREKREGERGRMAAAARASQNDGEGGKGAKRACTRNLAPVPYSGFTHGAANICMFCSKSVFSKPKVQFYWRVLIATHSQPRRYLVLSRSQRMSQVVRVGNALYMRVRATRPSLLQCIEPSCVGRGSMNTFCVGTTSSVSGFHQRSTVFLGGAR